jgi:hypothetical protein
MTLRYFWLAFALALFVALPASAQTRAAAPSLFPAEALRGGDFPDYTSILSGANEVPANATTGGGYAFGDLAPDGSFSGTAVVSTRAPRAPTARSSSRRATLSSKATRRSSSSRAR